MSDKSVEGVLTRAWFLLAVATFLAWWLGNETRNAGTNLPIAMASVLALALIKIWIVGFSFMELRRAATPFRLLFGAWAVGVTITLICIALL